MTTSTQSPASPRQSCNLSASPSLSQPALALPEKHLAAGSPLPSSPFCPLNSAFKQVVVWWSVGSRLVVVSWSVGGRLCVGWWSVSGRFVVGFFAPRTTPTSIKPSAATTLKKNTPPKTNPQPNCAHLFGAHLHKTAGRRPSPRTAPPSALHSLPICVHPCESVANIPDSPLNPLPPYDRLMLASPVEAPASQKGREQPISPQSQPQCSLTSE